MGHRASLKRLRRKAAYLVGVQQTPEQQARSVKAFYEHRIFNRKQAAQVLAELREKRNQNLNRG